MLVYTVHVCYMLTLSLYSLFIILRTDILTSYKTKPHYTLRLKKVPTFQLSVTLSNLIDF